MRMSVYINSTDLPIDKRGWPIFISTYFDPYLLCIVARPASTTPNKDVADHYQTTYDRVMNSKMPGTKISLQWFLLKTRNIKMAAALNILGHTSAVNVSISMISVSKYTCVLFRSRNLIRPMSNSIRPILWSKNGKFKMATVKHVFKYTLVLNVQLSWTWCLYVCYFGTEYVLICSIRKCFLKQLMN